MLPEGPPTSAETPTATNPIPGEPLATEATQLKPPRVWPVFVAFVVAVVGGQILAGITIVGVAALIYGLPALAQDPHSVVGDTVTTAPGLLAATLVSQAALGGVALVGGLLSPVGWRSRLRWVPGRLSYGGIAISAIGALAFSTTFSCLDDLGLLPESPMLEYLSQWFKSLDAGSRGAALLLIGVLPGIAEELLFRGYIQTRLCERWGRGAGVIVAAVLFGIMHVDPVHATFAFAFGLYLGYLTECSGSLRPAMCCHAINNSLSVLLGSLGWEIEGQAAILVWLAASSVLMVAVVYWLMRNMPAERPIVDSVNTLAEIPPAV